MVLARSRTDLAREEIASEARHWVRIARTCNNRCVFCLDSDVQDGTFVPRHEVEREIDRGLEIGARRLILSGGEATIHPDFLHLVRYGRSRGYSHVQTISNGRMFAYAGFTRKAVEAGLGEITFSMHGHTPDLQDELTGVPGSFAQTVAGITNAVASGIVVSGDVVVNRRNVRHLRDILDLFVGLGVREFDILMVVPFGRASPRAEDGLLFDLGAEIAHVRRALDLSRDPTLHVWTNRMDPAFLEGYEHLIQDPHKLHDEVRGRVDILEDLLDGRPMRCAGPRCSHCFIRRLCVRLQEAVAEVRAGVPGILRLDLCSGPVSEAVMERLGGSREVLWVRARDAAGVRIVGKARKLWLSLDRLEGLGRTLRAGGLPGLVRIVARRRRQVGEAFRMRPDEVVVVVNRSTAPILGALDPPAGTRVLFAYRPAPTLREAVDRDVDLRASLGCVRADGFVDVPPCLSGAASVLYEDPLDASAIRDDGRVDPDAFVSHFIRWLYRVKSLRCAGCMHDASCRGISVNLARHAGLGILEPVRV